MALRVLSQRVLQNGLQFGAKAPQADSIQILPATLHEVDRFVATQAGFVASGQAHAQASCSLDLR